MTVKVIAKKDDIKVGDVYWCRTNSGNNYQVEVLSSPFYNMQEEFLVRVKSISEPDACSQSVFITHLYKEIQLSYAEETELRYMHLKGFKYLVRNQIGSVNVFVNKPHRDKETNYEPYGKTRTGYDYWIETKTPISFDEQRRCKQVKLGNYSFIQWTDEPMLIEDLIGAELVLGKENLYG